MSPQEFANKIREKYPDAYQDIDDVELSQRVIAKYPVYAEQVNFEQPVEEKPAGLFERTVGQEVKEGTPLGGEGHTGNVYSTTGGLGTHLDYRIYNNAKKYYDPLTYLNKF